MKEEIFGPVITVMVVSRNTARCTNNFPDLCVRRRELREDSGTHRQHLALCADRRYVSRKVSATCVD
jgi:hypothetical protein